MNPGAGKSDNFGHNLFSHQLRQKLIEKFGSTTRGHIAMLQELGKPFQLVRDFALIDASSIDNLKASSVIMWLPSGNWHGFDLSYQEAIDKLSAEPERDDELIHFITTT